MLNEQSINIIFNVLAEAGIERNELNEELYQSTVSIVDFEINHFQRIDFDAMKNRLINILITLSEAGIHFNKTSRDFYLVAIRITKEPSKLAQAIRFLKDKGINYTKDNLQLYIAVMTGLWCIEQLPLTFSQLEQAGIEWNQNNQVLYLEAIFQMSPEVDLQQIFQLLTVQGISFNSDNFSLYHTIFKNLRSYQHFPELFSKLQSLGLNYNQEHKLIYINALAQAQNFNLFDEALLVLKRIKSKFQLEKHSIYEKIFEHVDNIKLIHQILRKFHFTQWVSKAEKKHYIENIIVQPALFEKALDALESIMKLQDKGIEPFDLYKKILDYFIHPSFSLKTMLNLITALTNFANEKNLLKSQKPDYQQQLQQVIHDSLYPPITYGPINKSDETSRFELLLQQIVTGDPNDINFYYCKQQGYVIVIKEEEIYLTLLLRHVNFTHINLDVDLIAAMGNLLRSLDREWELDSLENTSELFHLLPETSRIALQYYVSGKYRNMNALFRGEAFDEDPAYVWLVPLRSKENLLANLLCGCLVNDATNKLLLLPDELERELNKAVSFYQQHQSNENITHLRQDKEKYFSMLLFAQQNAIIDERTVHALKILINPNEVYIDKANLRVRQEQVSEEMKQARLANPQVMPSVTSFSVFKHGLEQFEKADSIHTKINSLGVMRVIMNRMEGEILIPQGEQLAYSYDANDNVFFASIVRSPDYVVSGGYWSGKALYYAHANHLSTPYKEAPEHAIIDDMIIERPNHGLAHTYRVMLILNDVIDYFSLHAKENAFKLFCQNLQPQDIEWLRVAAAFSITGRESEISAGENITRYNRYRQTCQFHLEKFLSTQPISDEIMQQRVLNIVRYMGNPSYEKTINDHEDEQERLHRNFLYRLLTIAHKLDLVRCYAPSDFEKSMQLCRDLSEPSQQQEENFHQLIRYTVNLCKAHGDQLLTDINDEGEWILTERAYTQPFEQVSHSMKRLFDVSATVKRPQLKQQISILKNEDTGSVACSSNSSS